MINYLKKCDDISANQLNGFFVGWPNPPSPETHLKILKGSYKFVLAVDDKTNNVVGFINCVSDGVLAAYIPLLEVLPQYKNLGIGKRLVELLLKDLSDLYMIDLLCDIDVQKFYKKIGLTEASGMLIRNYNNQSGKR